MQSATMNLKRGLIVVVGLTISACGGEGENGVGGGAGLSSGGAAGGGAGGTTGGSGGTAGSGGSNTAGTSSAGVGGSGAAGSGGSVNAGGTAGTGGEGGTTSEPCTPASTDGIAYSGTCTYADHCTDEYDTTFGTTVLQQICEGQSGTWSTTRCAPGDWDIKCTQAVLGGVYIQYMLADGICVLGCEEPL